MKKIAFFLCLSLVLQCGAVHPENPSLGKKSTTVAKSLALAYLGCLLYSISHESGHAILSKIFTGKKFRIHLGTTPIEKKKEIIDFGPVVIHSFNPLKNWAEVKESGSKIKNVLTFAGGGIAGALQSYLFLSTVAGYHKYQNCQKLGKSISYGLKNAFSPFKNMKLNKNMNKFEKNSHAVLMALCLMMNVRTLLYSLFPSSVSIINLKPEISKYADGTRVWQELGASKRTQKIACFCAWATEWILRFLIVKKTIDTIKN